MFIPLAMMFHPSLSPDRPPEDLPNPDEIQASLQDMAAWTQQVVPNLPVLPRFLHVYPGGLVADLITGGRTFVMRDAEPAHALKGYALPAWCEQKIPIQAPYGRVACN